MDNEKFAPKFGIVAILDALGASNYSVEKINSYLRSRAEIINEAINKRGSKLVELDSAFTIPNVYMFGDTIIVTLELDKNNKARGFIMGFSIIMSHFLFHSMQREILFRGAFSIGEYLEDGKSTVMGKAVTDAAAWYENSEWMGLSCTPKTKFVLEHYCGYPPFQENKHFLPEFPVPMKKEKVVNLYTIAWPRLFFNKELMEKYGKQDSKSWFIELVKEFDIPFGTECKYENTRNYFLACSEGLAR